MQSPAALIVFLLAVAGCRASFAVDYWEARADHVVVMAAGDARRAREIAGDFVRLEQAFAQMARWPEGTRTSPLVVFVVGVEDSRRFLLTTEDRQRGVDSTGLHTTRIFPLPTGVFLAFSGPKSQLAPVQGGYSLYASYLADTAATRGHPYWYRRGLAQLFADVKVDTGANEVRLEYGTFVLPMVKGWQWRGGDAMTIAQLLALDESVAWDDATNVSHARHSWLFMRYALIERPERREGLERYVAALSSGQQREAALSATIGGELPAWEKDFVAYRKPAHRREWVIQVAGPGSQDEPREVPAAERQERLGQLRRVVEHFDGSASK